MLRRRLFPRRRILVAFLLIVLIGGGLRAVHAAQPTEYQSTDERSYVRIAVSMAEQGRYGDPSLHWPPGAPVVFAAAYKLFPPDRVDERNPDIPSAYWAQMLIGIGTILAVFLLAGLLGGPVAGLVAAGVVAVYPPLVFGGTELLSEPLGALTVTLSVLAVAWAWWHRSLWRYAVAGVVFTIAVLVRADFLPIPFLVAGVVALMLLISRAGLVRSLLPAVAIVAGFLITLAPWSIHASGQAGKFVPVTDGAGPALFVGTFLPGGGSQAGMKRALEADIKKRNPRLRNIPPFRLKSASALRTVALRNPQLDRNASLQTEARRNIIRYTKREPVAFALMMLDKIPRIWMRYTHGRGRPTHLSITVFHIAIVLVSLGGLLAGLWRRRDPILAVILTVLAGSTGLHMLTVAIPRYNIPLMPILIAGGAAGAALALRGRDPGRAEGDPADDAGPSDRSAEERTQVLAPAGPPAQTA